MRAIFIDQGAQSKSLSLQINLACFSF